MYLFIYVSSQLFPLRILSLFVSPDQFIYSFTFLTALLLCYDVIYAINE